jgi:hypothetical protein
LQSSCCSKSGAWTEPAAAEWRLVSIHLWSGCLSLSCPREGTGFFSGCVKLGVSPVRALLSLGRWGWKPGLSVAWPGLSLGPHHGSLRVLPTTKLTLQHEEHPNGWLGSNTSKAASPQVRKS